jgi:hypothetical protein
MTGGDVVQPDVRALAPVAEGGVVNYYFPVEVEVVGEADDTLVQRVVAEVVAELDRELASRQ